jgi:hypothetical protein
MMATPAPRVSSTSSGETLHSFEVKVNGKVVGLTSAQLQTTRVMLYFPQMPYQVTRTWKQLDHPQASSFVLPVRVRAACPASLCQLRLQVGERRVEGGKVRVEASAQEVDLPPLRVP